MTFGARHYVPILKGKRGEYGALKRIPSDQRSGFTPLIEMIPPSRHGKARLPDDVLEKAVAGLADGWSGACFVDFSRFSVPEQASAAAATLTAARGSSLQTIPVVGIDSSSKLRSEISAAARKDKLGVSIRVGETQFEGNGIEAGLDELLAALGVSPSGVDLIVDLRDAPSSHLARALLALVPDVAAWRTLTLAATAMPRSLASLPKFAVVKVPRKEWSSWRLASEDPKNVRQPTFGDYGISHPDFEDLDPRLMRPSAKIRYTDDNDFLLIRGTQYSKDPQQFRRLSKAIRGVCSCSHSWGDAFSTECAGGGKTGSLESWIQAGTNHHIVHVTGQLASLP